jgi:hypothetical protein
MSESSIPDRIQADIAVSMKSKDAATLSTLRMLKAALLEAKTRKPKEDALTEDEVVEILQRYVKKRRETLQEMQRLGRDDLAGKEQREIDVTTRYLPQPLTDDEVRALVREAIAATGAAGPKDMGRVIGWVMGRVKGKAEGSVVSRLVKELLQGA